MNEDEMHIRAAIIQVAARMQLSAALDMLQEDSHQWSERPCPTCRAITGLLGRVFGCYKYAADRQKRNGGDNGSVK